MTLTEINRYLKKQYEGWLTARLCTRCCYLKENCICHDEGKGDK